MARNTPTKETTMTDEMMSLRAVLEKSPDADLLREMIPQKIIPPFGVLADGPESGHLPDTSKKA